MYEGGYLAGRNAGEGEYEDRPVIPQYCWFRLNRLRGHLLIPPLKLPPRDLRRHDLARRSNLIIGDAEQRRRPARCVEGAFSLAEVYDPAANRAAHGEPLRCDGRRTL